MKNPLKNLVSAQKQGKPIGLYSACSASPFVIEAVLQRGKETDSCVLIESTANQCDQYGGYTGMTPADFKEFVLDKAREINFDLDKLFLGGDHLGPLTFAYLPEKEAMEKAEELVRAYAAAGFSKIHLDTSMKVADDDPNKRLSDEVIARRGARLAKAANEEVKKLEEKGEVVEPVYIVGSEVPVPGGAVSDDNQEGLQVTTPEDFQSTMETFEKAFKEEGLEEVWDNVLAIVVQPGVEEKDAGCTDYDQSKAVSLVKAGRKSPLVFEGHSTDYQTREHLREMVEDGVAILKVGPGLTFAAREALYALAAMEDILYPETSSHFVQVLDQAMQKNPKYWASHYQGSEEEVAFKRHYSFSDRSRYYMNVPEVQQALNTMLENLSKKEIPLALISQYLPVQYERIRNGQLANTPKDLILDKIGDTIDSYLYATHQQDLF